MSGQSCQNDTGGTGGVPAVTTPERKEVANVWPVAATLDAGEENCAALILNVRRAIDPLRPGEILAVVAYDPSAQLDLRAWSRMAGHGYLGMDDHDEYAIYYLRKRGSSHGEDSGLR
jgi:tRNA 2-thiouridine synthesizing protein A